MSGIEIDTLIHGQVPQRPKSAFLWFVESHKDAIKEKDPKKTIKDIMANLRSLWDEYDSNQKAPYIKKSEEDKKRFQTEKEIYEAIRRLQGPKEKKPLKTQKSKKGIDLENEVGSDEENFEWDIESSSGSDSYEIQYFWPEEELEADKKDNKKNTKKSKAKTEKQPILRRRLPVDPNAPKKNVSPFIFFVDASKEEYKKNSPNKNPQELVSEMLQAWNNLTEEEKKPYVGMAEADKQRYEQEKEIYEKSKKNNAKTSKRKSDIPVDKAYISAIKEVTANPTNVLVINNIPPTINTQEILNQTTVNQTQINVVTEEQAAQGETTQVQAQENQAPNEAVDAIQEAVAQWADQFTSEDKAKVQKKRKIEENLRKAVIVFSVICIALVIAKL
mgnify:CR=1 FL=1